jgi:hypothetical protein
LDPFNPIRALMPGGNDDWAAASLGRIGARTT